eukprot:m.99014 g.99014  ORF g.99014 m.99014 type:complete len:361 (-) comp13659_c0_seq3:159-1241(-)
MKRIYIDMFRKTLATCILSVVVADLSSSNFSRNPCLMGFPIWNNDTNISTPNATVTTHTVTWSGVDNGTNFTLPDSSLWKCACADTYVGEWCEYSPGWTCSDHGTPDVTGKCDCHRAHFQNKKESLVYDWLGEKCQYYREGGRPVLVLVIIAMISGTCMAFFLHIILKREYNLIKDPMLSLLAFALLTYQIQDLFIEGELVIQIQPRRWLDGKLWKSEFYWKYTMIAGHGTYTIRNVLLSSLLLGLPIRALACRHFYRLFSPFNDTTYLYTLIINIALILIVEAPGLWANYSYVKAIDNIPPAMEVWLTYNHLSSVFAISCSVLICVVQCYRVFMNSLGYNLDNVNRQRMLEQRFRPHAI